MEKKQIIGLVVAALVFVFVCSSSILTNSLASKMSVEESSSSFLETLSSFEESFDLPSEDFVALVDVQGTIMDTQESLAFYSEGYNHSKTIRYIDALIESDSNTGIFLNVNSPGGGVYESDELYLKLLEYKEATGRPIWTYMGQLACSGGYYIAMASDNIVANRNGQTGSIGVIMSSVNLKELYDKIGIKETYYATGPNKTMGAASLDITKEQEEIINSILDESFDQFLGIVADGRDMDIADVKKIADGRIYTAKQALDLDMIDSIDTYENTVNSLLDETNSSILYKPVSDRFGFGSLFGAAMDLKPKSDVEIMSTYLEKQGNGVPMYYAAPW